MIRLYLKLFSVLLICSVKIFLLNGLHEFKSLISVDDSQMKQFSGYSIFVVSGALPDCQAHQILLLNPAVQVTQPERVEGAKSQGYRLGSASDDPDLERALRISLGQVTIYFIKFIYFQKHFKQIMCFIITFMF